MKYENIFQIFSKPGSDKIFRIRATFNWSSQFHSHSFLSLCELELILWQFLLLLQKTVFNSYSYMNWKWNWKGGNIQIFSSEIILAWENGSQGHNFGQILNSNFLKSLRHSAVVNKIFFHCLQNWEFEYVLQITFDT